MRFNLGLFEDFRLSIPRPIVPFLSEIVNRPIADWVSGYAIINQQLGMIRIRICADECRHCRNNLPRGMLPFKLLNLLFLRCLQTVSPLVLI